MPRHNGTPYQCEICEFKSPYKHHWVYHLRTHTKERPFACNQCDKTFTRKVHLTRHMRLHTQVNMGEKPYRQFQRTHTAQKPYKCQDCGKEYSSLSGLTYHTKSQKESKPYPYKCGPKNATTPNSTAPNVTINTPLTQTRYGSDMFDRTYAFEVVLEDY